MNIIDAAKKIPHGITAIAGWLGSGGVVVDQKEAQARADICNGDNPTGRRCVHNDSAYQPTETVAKAVRKVLEVKNGIGLRVKGEKILGSCTLCGCVLKLQIWQPQEKVYKELTETERLNAPKHCWKTQNPTTQP